jgi:SAM-dependent methyltransferase
MAGELTHLDPAPGAMAEGGHDAFGRDHPIRVVTREVAFGGAWTAESRERVAGIFDSMADEWTASHESEERYASLDDALVRGSVTSGRCLELGSGTGLGTARLVDHFVSVVALDLSEGMLRNAPSEYGHRIRGDSSELPIRTGSVDALVLVNMFLFPAEVDRVLGDDGQLVWVNTYAEETPIHLPAADVVAALPGSWTGVASRAGTGSWCVLRRA